MRTRSGLRSVPHTTWYPPSRTFRATGMRWVSAEARTFNPSTISGSGALRRPHNCRSKPFGGNAEIPPNERWPRGPNMNREARFLKKSMMSFRHTWSLWRSTYQGRWHRACGAPPVSHRDDNADLSGQCRLRRVGGRTWRTSSRRVSHPDRRQALQPNASINATRPSS